MPTTRLIAALLTIGIGGLVLYASFHAQYFPAKPSEQKPAARNEIYRPELLYIEDYRVTDNLLTPQYNTGMLGEGSGALLPEADTLTGKAISGILGPYYESIGESVGKSTAQQEKISKQAEQDLESELVRILKEAEQRLSSGAAIKLTASADNSPEAKQRYLDTMGKISLAPADFASLTDLTKEPSVTEFKLRLQFIIKDYDGALAQAVAVPVPSDWLTYMQDGLGALALQRDAFALLARGDEDPLAMTVAVDLLAKGVDRYAQAEQAFKAQL